MAYENAVQFMCGNLYRDMTRFPTRSTEQWVQNTCPPGHGASYCQDRYHFTPDELRQAINQVRDTSSDATGFRNSLNQFCEGRMQPRPSSSPTPPHTAPDDGLICGGVVVGIMLFLIGLLY